MKEDGSFSYTSDSDYTGEDSFTYKVNDGTEDSADSAVVTITVKKSNTPPQAVDDAYTAVSGNLLEIAAPGILENDSDADADALTAVLVNDVSHGVLSMKEDGSFSYTSDSDYTGEDSFTYKVNDGTEDSADSKVSIVVKYPAVTIGMSVNIKINEIVGIPSGDTFEKPAKILGEVDGKKLSLNKSKENPFNQSEVTGVWKKKVLLYDKKAVKSGYAKNINGSKQEKQIPLFVKGKTTKTGKIDNPTERKVRLVPPQIVKVSASNGTISAEGSFFGSKCPKVALEPTAGGKLIKCKADKKSYFFNKNTGASKLNATYKTEKVQPGTYNVIIDNKIGIGVNKTNKIPTLNM
jgi:VCBS repeat-containing protein